MRYLSEEEMIGKAAPQIEDDRRIYRLRLQKADFVKYGFTQGCPGCQAIVSGYQARGHSNASGARMENAMG